MSPTTLVLTVLGTVATSAGIGIAVVNLTTTNNENIEKKIKKLWEKIAEDIGPLASQVSAISKNQDSDINRKILSVLTKITTIATTKNNTYALKSYVNPQETYTQLQQIQKEMDEVLKLLEEYKENSI